LRTVQGGDLKGEIYARTGNGCSNCHDQLMKRVPKYYPDYPYEVKYIWELVADSLIIEPWTDEEIGKGGWEGKAQWELLGVDLDEEF